MKRVFDFCISGFALILLSPLLVIISLLIFLQDFHNPFYIAPRVGKGEKQFKMYKFRSMVVNADASGVDSTSTNDSRITPIGHFVRKFKLDEISQLFNVFLGDMSLVGPRPNVKRETDLYTKVEKKLLSVKPGITDFSSIVFADENEILKASKDPDIDYNQLIRPWKSRLGLLYIEKFGLFVDLKLLFLTAKTILNREEALKGVAHLLEELNASKKLIQIAKRKKPLIPTPPPGSNRIVKTRNS